MDKYVKRGLWGILIGFVVVAILMWISTFWIPPMVDCVGCLQAPIHDWVDSFMIFLAWPVILTDSLSIVSFLLVFVYWFAFGNVIGFLTEKIIKLLKNKR